MGEERGRRFEMALNGLRNADLATLVSVAPSTITGYRKGQIPSADNALAICRALNISMDWWINGTGDSELNSDVEMIPLRGSATNETIPYAKSLFQYLRIDPGSVFCVFAQGSLMSPSIPEFSEVMCTTNVTPLKDGRIYLVRAGSYELLRRVQILLDGRIQVLCDQKSQIDDQVELVDVDDIIGEVVWVSHRPQ